MDSYMWGREVGEDLAMRARWAASVVTTPSDLLAQLDALDLTPGEPCPLCGKQYGLSPAEKQRRYRERKRAG